MQSPLGNRFSRGAVRTGFVAVLALTGCALLLSPRDPAEAQVRTLNPKVKLEATVTPQTINVRELIRQAGTTDLAANLPIEQREIPLGRLEPPSDRVGQSGRGFFSRAVVPTPRAPEVVFDTIPSNGGEPSDDGIAVGPNHVVSAANVSWGVYNRTGTELFRVPFLTWYQGLDNTGFIFDPRVDYDENSGRYYLVTVGFASNPNRAELQISVSQTSDPLGNWHRYVFNVLENNPDQWGDFPCFGFNAEAMFCTTNNFQFNGGFTHTSLRIFNKALMLAGSPVTPRLLTFDFAFTASPVTSHDVTTNGWMVERASNSSVRLWKITNSLSANPTINTVVINVNSFDNPPVMAQQGSGRTLDGGDGRMANALLRNGQIWATHGVGSAGGSRGEVRVYQFNPAGNGTLAGQFAISDPTLNLHYPSIGMDQFGALLVGYATANANIFPSMHYSIKRPQDPQFGPATLMSAGTIAYDTGGTGTNRWGDYTDCAWDPAQPNIVWHSGQVAATQTLWVKRVGAIKTTPQSITVVTPNGGEVRERGVQTSIQWTSVSFTAPHTVRIELLDTVANTTTLLAAAAPETAGAGTFPWTPDNGLTLGKRYKIRVTSNENNTFFDESNDTFSVQAGSIEVVSPNGGEIVIEGEILPIQWNALDFAAPPTTPAVRIELSRDGGGTWEVLFANAPNTGTAQWVATADPNTGEGTTDALIRVTATNSGLTFQDDSDGPFEIRLPSKINCTQPFGGTFTPGQVLTIAWTRQGFVGGVKVELSRNAGATWETLFPDVDGVNFAQWTVTGPATKLGRVRVSSITEPDVSALSLGVFEVVLQSITVTGPAAGAKALTGINTNITWNSAGLGGGELVNVELSVDGGGVFKEVLAAGTPNDGHLAAILGTPTPNALVRVTSVSNPSVFGLSSSFSISEPTLFLVSPNGGNAWKVGTQEIVQWSGTVVGHGQVTLEVSRNGGATWGPLGNATGVTPNDGAQSVGVNGPASKKVLVRATWSLSPLSDQSDAFLQISESKAKKKPKKKKG